MKIVTISGRARNGKDTVARLISDVLHANGKKVLITHYADLLKFLCRNFFDWNGEKDEKGRTLLQFVGTDVVRKKNPDFWVDFIITILSFFEDQWDYVIIPDARFPNEINRLKEAGFDVTCINVIRDNYDTELTEEQQNHPSETALRDYPFDWEFHNNKTMEELKAAVPAFVDLIFGGNV